MLKSMTAYSRSISVGPLGRFVVELQSVNRKFLEVNTYLPKTLLRFDADIKKWIGQQVLRGQINVRLSATFDQVKAAVVKPNLPLAAQLKSSWDQIAKHLGISPAEFSLGLISSQEGLLEYEEELDCEGEVKEALCALFSRALEQLAEMKLREGAALQADISQRLESLKRAIDIIEAKAPESVKKYREKLQQKLQEALAGLAISDNDERLLKEVCLFADKVDVAEEITRFNSHLGQFRVLLDDARHGVGKTLEFLVQELNREVNTIGSKSADVEIARLVIDIKAELERIREQIQNVE